MTTSHLPPNALRLPWIPVALPTGEQTRLGLVDLLTRAHEITGLGSALTPLDRDTLMRFLPTVTALVLREIDDENERFDVGETGRFPLEAVAAFASRYDDYFYLSHPEHPFLQRWDIHRSDVDGLTSKVKGLIHDDPNKAILKPLQQMHPHAPGGSSARWAIRRDSRDPASDLGSLTLLLAVTWWQTRRGNGKGPDGRALQNGNPGQAGVRPMSVFWMGDNLGRTICANTPAAWVTDDNFELPMWLDQTATPPSAELADAPGSLWRTTYARNLPFVYFDDNDRPLGYVIGPTTYDVPVLGMDEKASLAAMHGFDYARLFEELVKKGQPTTTRQVPSLGARLSSTEGYTRWYRNRLNDTLRSWGNDRIVNPVDEPDWAYGIYGEVCHTTGAREWSDWAVLDRAALSPDPRVAVNLATLLKVVEDVRTAMYSPMRIACEGRAGKQANDPVLLESTQTSFYAAVEETLTQVLADVVAGVLVDWHTVATEIGRVGSRVFHISTECLTAPSTLPQVSLARTRLDSRVRSVISKVYTPAETNKLKGSVA